MEGSSLARSPGPSSETISSPALQPRAWLRVQLRDYGKTSDEEKLGQLSAGVEASGFVTQYTEQFRTWRESFSILAEALPLLMSKHPAAAEWTLLLEYPIPRRQKRIDAVILAGTVILVLEFKVGAKRFARSDMWQAEDYALDLRDFHEASRGRPIVPILVATEAPAPSEGRSWDSTFQVHHANQKTLPHTVLRVALQAARAEASPIDAAEWEASSYRPTPTIVEAVQHLFAGNTVRNLSHAYADNLTATVDALAAESRAAQAQSLRTICFVTGVPGAGKTLAGLAAVHEPSVSGGTEGHAAFMSGNGPLVRVLREAIVRNQLRRGVRRGELERKSELLIQNVHEFIEEYGVKNRSSYPHEHVIVFDEAQRAWHADKVGSRHKDVQQSEPAMVLESMARVPHWCVVIALVGGGQEIHSGEAGLEEWGRALKASPVPWRVVVSPEVLSGGTAVAQHFLFDAEPPPHLQVVSVPSMHLSVSVRSPRAQRIAEWVNAVLTLDEERARRAIQEISGFRMALTRDLSVARAWLKDSCRGDRRPGLLASSGSLRHRAYGLELTPGFLDAFPVENWFLDGASDVRSSHCLEVAMTEFKCQGLELDYVGLCWGDDLTVQESRLAWDMRTFKGNGWRRVNRETAQQYLLNKYRVLLTRAREGLVVWVPPGSADDPTREPGRLDRTAAFLERCGVPLLERSLAGQQA
ncbi:DUF2075 domain-containing protein [Stigmatella aurantiaca]|uniref:DUF2075 domain-containing protein n=1 Tax=Stigmatella aurantiaca TaxID=41 RepID=UPI0009F65D3B|nr:DUF2075 domain-containing protein [Stigmatella aurantiaca]